MDTTDPTLGLVEKIIGRTGFSPLFLFDKYLKVLAVVLHKFLLD